MTTLHMEVEVARNAQSIMANTYRQLTDLFQSLSSVVGNLQLAWIGPSSAEFLQDYEWWKSRMNLALEELDTISTKLQAEIAEWEQVASSLATGQHLPATRGEERPTGPEKTPLYIAGLLGKMAVGMPLSAEEMRQLADFLLGPDEPGIEETVRLTVNGELDIPLELFGLPVAVLAQGELEVVLTRTEEGMYRVEVLGEYALGGELDAEVALGGKTGAESALVFVLDPNNGNDMQKIERLLKRPPDFGALADLAKDNLQEIRAGSNILPAIVGKLGGAGGELSLAEGGARIWKNADGSLTMGRTLSLEGQLDTSLLVADANVDVEASLFVGERVDNPLDVINPWGNEMVYELEVDFSGRGGVGIDTGILPYEVGGQLTGDVITGAKLKFTFDASNVNPAEISQRLLAGDWSWLKEHSRVVAEVTSGIGGTGEADLAILGVGGKVSREFTKIIEII